MTTPAAAAAGAPAAPANDDAVNQPAAAEAAPGTTAPPEAVVESTAEPTQGGDYFVYEPTGDVGLDVALEFVGRLGFAADNPAMKAASTGDFTALENALKALGAKAKGFEKYTALGKAYFESRTKAVKAAEDATTAAIYAAVGGESAWKEIGSFVEQHADAGEKAAINAAIKAGGIQATAMAEKLAALYQRAAGKPRKVVKDEAGAAAPANTATPLTAAEYAREVARLRAANPRRPVESTPAYQELQARRRASKS